MIPPIFLIHPQTPTPIQQLPTECPVCNQPAAANEVKAYGRCESCYVNPRIGGVPLNIARAKRPIPRKSRSARTDDE